MNFAFGIEEEFFVVSQDSGDIEPQAHDQFIARARQLAGGNVNRELLQSQIEIATPICHGMGEARHHLSALRSAVATAASEFGRAILAAGTHPTADWSEQVRTPKQRYDRLAGELQMLAMRNLVCGMHVHVGLPDDALRIDVMRRSIPFLPLLLALSCSSPFWRGMNSGFSSYRMTSYDELPRTGLPPLFASWSDYVGYVEVLKRAGIIRDASYCWWAIRPSHAHPTLELRIPDTCTRLEDAVTIAAVFRCLVRALVLDPSINASLGPADAALAAENKWRVQRHGTTADLIDPFRRRDSVDVATAVDDLVDWLGPHAEALECRPELECARTILTRGTSADRQVAIFDEAIAGGDDPAVALTKVTDWLARETATVS